MKLTKEDFKANFSACAEIADLDRLGWVFDDYYENYAKHHNTTLDNARQAVQDNYHVKVSVDGNGKTFYEVDHTYGNYYQSEIKETGEDIKTIKDLYILYCGDELWDINSW